MGDFEDALERACSLAGISGEAELVAAGPPRAGLRALARPRALGALRAAERIFAWDPRDLS